MTTLTRHPPGPKVGLLHALLGFGGNLLGMLERAAREHGDIVFFRIGPRELYFVNDPELIHDILVTHHDHFMKGLGLQRAKHLLGEGLLTSEGAFHRRQRRLIQPAFHHERIAGYGPVMTEYACRLEADWQDGHSTDLAHDMMRLTLGIAGRTLFSAEVTDEADEIGQALTEAMDRFVNLSSPLNPLLDRLRFLPRNRRFMRAKARLDATILRLIEERRAEGKDRGDLLSMLLVARDASGEGMSDQQVRDEAMTLLLAGHETTANLLTWTFYLLSEHPQVEACFHEELDVLDGRLPTAGDLPRLAYTRMVLTESMRLYPPAYLLGRIAIKDYMLGTFPVRAGAALLMSPYIMHRTAKYYPEPERFDPERWRPGAQAKRPKFAYFPFGGGPRICIGEGFAWMEGVLVLATLAQRWQLRHVKEHKVALRPLITLRPKYGMQMTLHRRQV